jgi:hypothetical protein
MKRIAIVLAVLALFACSTEDSARGAWRAFTRPCDRNSFTYSVNVEANVSTFTATCKVKP